MDFYMAYVAGGFLGFFWWLFLVLRVVSVLVFLLVCFFFLISACRGQ